MLGIFQGIVEWLPLSSEGINSLIMVNFCGKSLAEAAFYSIWLHTGTLLAAIIYFRAELVGLLRNVPSYIKNPKSDTGKNRLTTFLIVSTVLTGIIGLPILLFGISNANVSGGAATAFIGILLIFTGLLQKYSKNSFEKKEITLLDSALLGILQAFSVLPGISRSGITTSTLLLRKYDARSALKLSFLMSIPAVFVAEVGLGALDMIVVDVYSMLSVAISFIVGLLSIGILMNVAHKINFGNFCIFLGILSLLVVFI